VIVRVDEAALDPGVIVLGDNVHVMPLPAEQLSEIGLLNPPTALALTDKVADFPDVTVAVCAERDNAKFALPTAVAGISEAKRPLVCVLPPAVK
jgi:hypothetical protein